jgi:hypothetical protein
MIKVGLEKFLPFFEVSSALLKIENLNGASISVQMIHDAPNMVRLFETVCMNDGEPERSPSVATKADAQPTTNVPSVAALSPPLVTSDSPIEG